jgi:hypothetical protein
MTIVRINAMSRWTSVEASEAWVGSVGLRRGSGQSGVGSRAAGTTVWTAVRSPL